MTVLEILAAAGIDLSHVEIDEGGHYDFQGGETIEYRNIVDTQTGFKIGDVDDSGNVRLDGKYVGTAT